MLIALTVVGALVGVACAAAGFAWGVARSLREASQRLEAELDRHD